MVDDGCAYCAIPHSEKTPGEAETDSGKGERRITPRSDQIGIERKVFF